MANLSKSSGTNAAQNGRTKMRMQNLPGKRNESTRAMTSWGARGRGFESRQPDHESFESIGELGKRLGPDPSPVVPEYPEKSHLFPLIAAQTRHKKRGGLRGPFWWVWLAAKRVLRLACVVQFPIDGADRQSAESCPVIPAAFRRLPDDIAPYLLDPEFQLNWALDARGGR
jgi:hypothetical protein